MAYMQSFPRALAISTPAAFDLDVPGRSELIKKLRQKSKKVSQACLDDVAAIETGMELENQAIEFFLSRQKEAAEQIERELLSQLIAEERSHYIMLSDLRFYYIDTEHWLMEKAKTGLDGA